MAQSTNRQTIAWGAAGIPLLIALVQTLLALFGYTASSAGLSPIAEPILSVQILLEAAIVFKESSALVMGLFLLIAVSWTGQGITMLLIENRQVAYGLATLSAVLFFVLFFGVYAPLRSADVPTEQLVAFYLVPVCAASLQLYAVQTYPWGDVVLEETSGDLGRLESELDRIESRFQSRFQSRFGRLDSLEDVAPNGVRTVREERSEFRDRLTELRSEITEARSISDPDTASATRANLEAELDSLNPEERIADLDEQLQQTLASGIRTKYGEFIVRSKFGRRYEIVNLPTEHRELALPDGSSGIHINDVDEALLKVVREADSYETVADAIEAVEDHLSAARSYIQEREDTVVKRIQTTEDRLETVTKQVESLDVPFRDRIEEVLVEGRVSGLTGVADIREKLTQARTELHECMFDDAVSIAEAAANDASTLVTTVEYLSTLEVSIEDTHESVSIPRSVPLAYIEPLLPAIQKSYPNISIDIEEDARAIVFSYETKSHSESTDDKSPDSTASQTMDSPGIDPSTTRVAAPEGVVDEVLYAFRDFESNADSEERIVQYRLEDLPNAIATQDVLVNIERFASRQSDLFDAVDLQGPEPPGLIEFTATDKTDIDRALKEARERFREKYT